MSSSSSDGETYKKTPVESVDELSVDDHVDVFYSSGWEHAVVVDLDTPGRTLGVELSSGADKLLIKEYTEDNQTLLEWRQGTEEDFADWRPKGDVQNIKIVEKQLPEAKEGVIERVEELSDQIEGIIDECESSSTTFTGSFISGLEHAKTELDVTTQHERETWGDVDAE